MRWYEFFWNTKNISNYIIFFKHPVKWYFSKLTLVQGYRYEVSIEICLVSSLAMNKIVGQIGHSSLCGQTV